MQNLLHPANNVQVKYTTKAGIVNIANKAKTKNQKPNVFVSPPLYWVGKDLKGWWFLLGCI